MGKRGKQSGIRYGQKKQNGQSDTEQLVNISRHLHDILIYDGIKPYKIKPKREPYLIFGHDDKLKSITDTVSRNQTIKDITTVKNPDLLWIDKYGMWIIEVDGAIHDRKTEKTRQRNELFISNHIKLIVVNLADIKELGLNIYDYIDSQILERIRNG